MKGCYHKRFLTVKFSRDGAWSSAHPGVARVFSGINGHLSSSNRGKISPPLFGWNLPNTDSR